MPTTISVSGFAMPEISATPAVSGLLRVPAEWEPQEALWLSWPANPDTWPGRRERIEAWFARFAALAARFEPVRINADPSLHREIQRRLDANAPAGQVELFPIPVNDAWCRDHGAVFAFDQTGRLVALDFRYNAWGEKFSPWDLDALAAGRMAKALGIPCLHLDFVCEGGALEFDGQGSLITTASVILDPARNPGATRASMEARFREFLDLETFCCLPAGLHDDDTGGHADTFVRFFPPAGILTLHAPASHRDAAVLADNTARLTAAFPHRKMVTLPLAALPAPAGWRQPTLPALYANYVVLNGAVLVPAYGLPTSDAEAVETIGACFPDREVLPVDCRDLILEGGGLHCISQQQPAA